MASKHGKKLIFAVLTLIQLPRVTVTESCRVSNGNAGVCVNFSACERDKDSVLFMSDFCTSDYTVFCCESERVKIPPPVHLVVSTTERANAGGENRNSFESFESFKTFDMTKCGALPEVNRISGGVETELFEFPWSALIGYNVDNKIAFNCGGSLINDFFVLTAAHCLQDRTKLRNDVRSVRLGEHRKSTTVDCVELVDRTKVCSDPVQDIPIDKSNMIVHPEFNTLTKQNDIALIRLSERAKINQNNIKAICLPLRSELEKLPPLLIVIGFGRTESSKSNSDVLLKVSVRTVSNDECVAQYENTSLRLIEKQFCAGNSKDSCEGDSGSSIQFPSFFDGKSPRYVQYGVVSYGANECGSSHPGVYTKVHPYLSWILQNAN